MYRYPSSDILEEKRTIGNQYQVHTKAERGEQTPNTAYISKYLLKLEMPFSRAPHAAQLSNSSGTRKCIRTGR
ncbi:hypothetical protein NDU88_002450 [Pleurodeles waltl]|uniref:Uncharacterized protein n=1 Tax=Pleurodeles waltl TaxID=8319 RepID=A0AAV7T2E6_PLEWA|nr:hypothetical protein NDU88_002450 [Pleurodeles waltl]